MYTTRIIPAYAGSTSPLQVWAVRSWDHPRVCGEHANKHPFISFLVGSSPRMRGAPEVHRDNDVRRGIIPAYAGSTDAVVVDNPPFSRIIPAYAGSTGRPGRDVLERTDHPRVCGEHDVTKAVRTTAPGSSPRMRGARVLVGGDGGLVGIIPAYAGSTGRRTPQRHRSHGSSPRMRGARNGRDGEGSEERIIPAYAGSTISSALPVFDTGDHPRVCGEHLWQAVPKAWRAGSSPRMRGALWQAVPKAWRAGIIPAYAGSTDVENRRPVDTWDHPRVCGEHGSD